MATIYDIDYNLQAENIIPPDKRKPRLLAYLKAIVLNVQTLRDRFFNWYADGFVGDFWGFGMGIGPGEYVIGPDNAVYECTNPLGITSFIPPGLDPANFVKIQDVYIGLRERLKYNSRKIVLEYILNKWFRVAVLPDPQIYITNNDIYGTAFLMGATGPTSSSMANLSTYQTYFLGNVYTYGANAFTIYVPTAIFAALDPDPTNAENIIRAIADKYVIAGMIYNVVTY